MKTGAFRLARVSKVRNHVRGEVCMTEHARHYKLWGGATVYPRGQIAKIHLHFHTPD